MSFLDRLFGGGARRRDLGSANSAATSSLTQSRDSQLAALNGANATARDDINSGLGNARIAFGSGFDRARGDLSSNYGNAEGAINSGMDRARNLLNPMIALGGRYDSMYADAMGANGAEARTRFYDQNIRGNQEFAAADDMAAKQLAAKLNASGVTGGRAAALQLRQGSARIEDRTNQYLDRIANQGARGAQTASQLAGMESNAGSQLAGIRTGLGDRLSGLEAQRGGALAGLEMQGSGMLSNAALQTGQSVAGVHGGYGQNMAANAINYGNAMGQTRGSGINSMLQLAGLGIQGFTPGRDGNTPFGNFGRGVGRLFG